MLRQLLCVSDEAAMWVKRVYLMLALPLSSRRLRTYQTMNSTSRLSFRWKFTYNNYIQSLLFLFAHVFD